MQHTLSVAIIGTLFTLSAALQAQATTRPYGQVNGWNAIVFSDGGRFTGCGASHPQMDGEAGVALSADGNWMLAFEMMTPQGIVPATLSIDGQTFYFSATGQGNQVSFAPSLQMMNLIRAGNSMTMSVQGGGSYTATLVGSSAAMTMVQNCVARRGN